MNAEFKKKKTSEVKTPSILNVDMSLMMEILELLVVYYTRKARSAKSLRID